MRRNFFDNGKALASVLGFFYHVGLVFSSPWIINTSIENFNNGISFLAECISLFRMPLFVFISGYFAIYSVKKYNLLSFSKNKLLRLGLPLVSTLYTFVLIQNIYAFVLYREEYNFSQAVQTILPWSDYFDLSHLWFLYLVLIYSFLLFITVEGFKKYTDVNVFTLMKRQLHRMTNRSLDISFIFFSFGLLVFSWMASKVSPFSPELVPIISFGTFLPYFILGMMLYSSWDKYQDLVLNFSFKRVLVISGLMMVALYFMNLTVDSEHLIGTGIYLLFAIIAKYYALLLVLYVLYKYFNKTNRFLRYLGDSSYSVYLLHHPVIVIVSYYYLTSFNTSAIVGYIGILIISIGITYLLDFLIIRKTKAGKLLYTGTRPL